MIGFLVGYFFTIRKSSLFKDAAPSSFSLVPYLIILSD